MNRYRRRAFNAVSQLLFLRSRGAAFLGRKPRKELRFDLHELRYRYSDGVEDLIPQCSIAKTPTSLYPSRRFAILVKQIYRERPLSGLMDTFELVSQQPRFRALTKPTAIWFSRPALDRASRRVVPVSGKPARRLAAESSLQRRRLPDRAAELHATSTGWDALPQRLLRARE